MKQLLTKFIEQTVKAKEFQLFLDLMHATPSMRYAVIKVSGSSLENQMDTLAESLVFLSQLGLFPVMVHGAGSAIDEKLPHSVKKDGLRVTSKEGMGVIAGIFERIAQVFVSKIEEKGGKAGIARGVFSCTSKPGYGQVGDINAVSLAPIEALVSNGILPIVSPIGFDSNGTPLNINADTAAKSLVNALCPKKFLLITDTGGILDSQGKLLSFINLTEDYSSYITGGMLLKVNEIKEFLQHASSETAVVITSAENLLKELFTVKGCGTFIKYHVIHTTDKLSELDLPKVKFLLEDAFQKTLVDDYFKDASKFKRIIYQKDYEGIVILKEINGIPYLDKFAVLRSCSGNGLGKTLWLETLKHYPKMIWRAAAKNPFNGFYYGQSDGTVKTPEWHVFWRNLDEAELLSAVKAATQLPKTLLEVSP